jgi:hypothetical protein
MGNTSSLETTNWIANHFMHVYVWQYVYIYIQFICGDGSKPYTLVNIQIAGKWMLIPLKLLFIGIDP